MRKLPQKEKELGLKKKLGKKPFFHSCIRLVKQKKQIE
jgi:hypothetical protein